MGIDTLGNKIINTVTKLWGTERWLVNEPNLYCVKEMILQPGYECSLHYHNLKDETFYVVSGGIMLTVNGINHRLGPGDFYRLYPGDTHKFRSLDAGVAVFIECSTFHSDDDVVRLMPAGRL